MNQPQPSLRFFTARRFFPLFLTQLFDAFNDNVFKYAFTILATFHFARTHGWDPSVITQIIAALFVLPFFLFSAIAGQIADKYDKARIVVLTKICEVAIVILGSIALLTETPALLFATIVLLGAQSAFFGPLKYSLLPQHLNEDELVGGNAIFEAATYIAILIGTVIGGQFILTSGGSPNPAPICLLMLASSAIGLVAARRIPPAPSENPDLKINRNLLDATTALIKNAARNAPVFRSILGISWFWLIGAFWLTLTPAYVEKYLNAGAAVVTTLLIIFAVGIGIGSMLCNKILRGEITAKFVPLAGIAISIFMADAALLTATLGDRFQSTPFTFASFTGIHLVIDLLGIAIAGGIFSVPLYAFMQRYSAPTHRSRIIAANNVLNSLFMVTLALVVAILFKIGVPTPLVILLFAIINLAVALYIIALVPEAVIHTFLRWLLKFLYKVEVHGLANYKAAGRRRVIIANHTSYLDAVLLTAFLPERPTFAVATEYAQKWWIKALSRLVNFYPVDPTNALAIKKLTYLARTGTPVAIFPEGRLTTTGGIMKVYEGPGLIADKANADLIPVQIDGAIHTAFSRVHGKVRSRWFPKITLSILPPRKFHPPENLHGRDGRQHMAQELYDILTQIHLATSDTTRPLFQALVDAAIRNGHSSKIIDDTRFKPLTYRKLLAASLYLGRKLCQNTRAGEPIGLLIANSTPAVAAFFGVQSMGRVAAMLNYSAGPASITAACQATQIKHAWTSRKFVEIAKLHPLVEAMEKTGVTVHYLEDAAKRTWRDYLLLPLYLRNARWIAARRAFLALRDLNQQQATNVGASLDDARDGAAAQEGARSSSATTPNNPPPTNSAMECGDSSPLSTAGLVTPPPAAANVSSQAPAQGGARSPSAPPTATPTPASPNSPDGAAAPYPLPASSPAGATITAPDNPPPKSTAAKNLSAAKEQLYAAIAATRSKLIASIQEFTRYDESALADKPAVILFTSGSSGTPKGVVLSHRNLQTNRYQLVSILDVTPQDHFFGALPIFHAFGLTGCVVAPLLHGTRTFMYPTPLHYGIIPELVYQTNATVIFGTNTFLAGYARRAHPYDFYSVRFAVAGAEKLKPEIRQHYSEQFGVRVFEAYGVTEASPGICINTPMHNRPGTVGQFLPGIQWRLDPVPGIEHGGQLWVRADNIMLGYLLHESPGQLIPPPDGWYDTGDIVDIDPDGYVTILGRVKRFAKIAGEMVSLTTVEELALSLWPENQHAAITKPHPQKGEEILLITDNKEATRQQLIEAAKTRGLPELAIPRQVIIRETIPLLGAGKPDYPALEQEYQN